ncbi:twin-arginine translocase TatA/TatE family subunit [Opitutaceae bacterium EW11]|nr:twin-arginine translocase TatA/TatE family subunit [Opitutaceae bacterium EW11]
MNSLFALPLAGILGLGGPELLLVFLVILLLFGGAKLPALARGLGQSIREFKKASNEDDEPKAEAKKAESAKSESK